MYCIIASLTVSLFLFGTACADHTTQAMQEALENHAACRNLEQKLHELISSENGPTQNRVRLETLHRTSHDCLNQTTGRIQELELLQEVCGPSDGSGHPQRSNTAGKRGLEPNCVSLTDHQTAPDPNNGTLFKYSTGMHEEVARIWGVTEGGWQGVILSFNPAYIASDAVVSTMDVMDNLQAFFQDPDIRYLAGAGISAIGTATAGPAKSLEMNAFRQWVSKGVRYTEYELNGLWYRVMKRPDGSSMLLVAKSKSAVKSAEGAHDHAEFSKAGTLLFERGVAAEKAVVYKKGGGLKTIITQQGMVKMDSLKIDKDFVQEVGKLHGWTDAEIKVVQDELKSGQKTRIYKK